MLNNDDAPLFIDMPQLNKISRAVSRGKNFTGQRGRRAETRGRESGDEKTEIRDQKSDVGERKNSGQRTEDEKTEIRSRRSIKERGQRTEVGSRRSEVGYGNKANNVCEGP